MAEIVQVRPEPTSLRLIVTLALTGLLSGIILVGVYLGTAPRIERNRAEAMTAAIYRVLPEAGRIEAFVVEDDTPRPYDGPEGSIPKGEAVFAGYRDDGTLVGFAIPGAGPGFMDTIGLIYGYDPERRVIVGMEVLESRETPGLGDKIIYDEDFLANFEALAIEPEIVPVKGERTRPNEVDCITGATISSEAVVKILNASTSRWLPRLEKLVVEGPTEGEVASAREPSPSVPSERDLRAATRSADRSDPPPGAVR